MGDELAELAPDEFGMVIGIEMGMDIRGEPRSSDTDGETARRFVAG
jgi:hypothetical protein